MASGVLEQDYRKTETKANATTPMRNLTAIAAALTLACSFGSNAYALTINDPGVVGAIGNEAVPIAKVATLLPAAQRLLDMAANTSDPSGCSLKDACYRTSNAEYAAILTDGLKVDGGKRDLLNYLAYDYVLAKYNGISAGYVLFHIPTWVAKNKTTLLPQVSYGIWGNKPGQYDISNFTVFNATSVPEGGTTLSLLGFALLGLGALRRRWNL